MRHLGWFVLILAASGLGLTAPTRAQQEEAERRSEEDVAGEVVERIVQETDLAPEPGTA